MSKPIKDYIPVKIEMVLVQARVPTDLVNQVRLRLEQNDLTLSKLITACLKKYLDETQGGNRK